MTGSCGYRPNLGSRDGRVEDWRAGLGRSLYSLFLALSFASVTLSRPCHVSSPRHVERSVRISRTALSCLLHLKGYGTYRADSGDCGQVFRLIADSDSD